jgi:hypothetical protein
MDFYYQLGREAAFTKLAIASNLLGRGVLVPHATPLGSMPKLKTPQQSFAWQQAAKPTPAAMPHDPTQVVGPQQPAGTYLNASQLNSMSSADVMARLGLK